MDERIQKIKNGEVSLGLCLTYPAAGIIENVGKDWDWVWLDTQHGQLDRRALLDCVRTADSVGIPSVIRIPGHDSHLICDALDMGAQGIMVPMVESAEQAERIVREIFYPPRGKRSYGGRRVNDLYGTDYLKKSLEGKINLRRQQ